MELYFLQSCLSTKYFLSVRYCPIFIGLKQFSAKFLPLSGIKTFIYNLCYTSIQNYDNYVFGEIAFKLAIDAGC